MSLLGLIQFSIDLRSGSFLDHITYIADIGYDYKSSIQYMASDLAKSLNKNTKSKRTISVTVGFMDL